jgi:hypothetical protein
MSSMMTEPIEINRISKRCYGSPQLLIAGCIFFSHPFTHPLIPDSPIEFS